MNQSINIDQPISFLTIASSFDIMTEAAAELMPNLQIFSLEDLLQTFGQVGICFKSRTANYPDPWMFRVTKVYDCYLSQQDLYAAFMSKTQLKVPGTDSIITGVDVINGTDAYVCNRIVNQIHCSVAMNQSLL